jgi:transposase
VGVRRKFTREFKLEALRPILSGEKSLTQVASELGISRSMLQHWRQQHLEDPQQAFPGNGRLKPDEAELARLRRENLQLRQECDVLKKAIAIFSSPRGSDTR